MLTACALLVLPLLVPAGPQARGADPGRYDVVWDAPSPDASGSMPLGNGEIALNAWVEPDGALVFYIARTDSWSENGRLLKVGRLRITTEPPLDPTAGFEQRLDLGGGQMVVRCAGQMPATLRLWVDANHPAVQVEIESAEPRTATATIDPWRTERVAYPAAEVSDLLEDRSKPGHLHEPVFVEPDTVLTGLEGRIGWLHHNASANGTALVARIQGLAEYFESRPDPLLQRTFGAVVSAPGGERLDDLRLRSPAGPMHAFTVVVHTEHPATPDEWLAAADRLAAKIVAVPLEQRRSEHRDWWQAFWGRSWIRVTEGAGAARSSMVPANDHPVRIGVDADGANRFAGELGRWTITPGAATDVVVERLAEGHDDLRALRPLYAEERPRIGGIEGSQGWSFPDGLTIEGWVRPEELPPGGGRLVDKLTPGGSDGFLLDTYPGNSLRLIVGNRTLTARDVLPPGERTHVAAVVAPRWGLLALYVNGAQVTSEQVEWQDDAAVVSRAYALQRWVDASAGRGTYPIKFNGSLFTVPHEGTFGDADYRRWGPGYWWQNTRLPYLSMCASGDFEMLRPLFGMYVDDLLGLHVWRTQLYTGHGGAFVPECMLFWGPTFTATYGWTPFDERGDDKLQESGWHKREWVSGLELVWMMLDYWEHTQDPAFARETLIPAARTFLGFFAEHYPRDEHGKLVMEPSQALETWWDCTNPMPELAGLHAVTARLLAMPESLTTPEDRRAWRALQAALPDLPTREVDGVRMLAPAERFADKRNVENPALYAVFPFRLVTFATPDVELGRRALEARWDRGASGWRQDDLFMTHLGLADQARDNLVRRARSKHAGSRFPVFWGPNYDWVPDQDHGGVLMRTLQTMLMQTDGRAIHLLPAWPDGWNAEFRLHAPYGTVITGKVEGGSLVELEVLPPSRRADVIVH